MFLLEGKSIRETAEEVGLDKDTVQRIWKRAAKNWEMLLEEFLEDLNLKGFDFESLTAFPRVNLWRSGMKKRKKKTAIYPMEMPRLLRG